MLGLIIKGTELFNEQTSEFIEQKPISIKLEHSLLSISKWESIWHVPFIKPKYDKTQHTTEQILSYIECMCLTPNVPVHRFSDLTKDQFDKISVYISTDRTATWFSNNKGGNSTQAMTSELVYSYMVAFRIPFECEKWHLSRLLTLIRICAENNKSPKDKAKGSTAERLARQRVLNAKRKAELGISG